MKAAVLAAVRTIVYGERAIPPVGENDILVRVVRTGVCGSDLSTYRGTHPYKTPPVILGHECTGVVEAVGVGIDSFVKGDRVCTVAYSPCNQCSYCRRRKPQLCPHKGIPNFGGWEGSFAEYCIAKANSTFRITEGIRFECAVLVEPLATGLHAVRTASELRNKDVVILGTGNIGMCCLLCVKQLRPARVVCIDVNASRADGAYHYGVDRFVDVSNDSLPTTLRSIFPEKADVTIVASGHPSAVSDAVAITKRGGEVILVSYFDESKKIDFNQVVRNEHTLKGSALYDDHDVKTIIEWLDRKVLDPEAMVSHEFSLEEAATAMDFMDKNVGVKGKIVLRVPGE